MGTITKKIIKLIEEKEGLLSNEIREHLIGLKEEINNLKKEESDLINRTFLTFKLPMSLTTPSLGE